MRFGSVCSGIDAASVAWGPLGWRCAFVSEIEPAPSAVLAHRYPGVKNLGDFTTIGDEWAGIDVLVGGTPCQGFSVAGLRKGLDDDRSNLALGFLRLVGRLRPDWVVWENVPGVLTTNGGRDFGAFLGGLEELGYRWAYRVLDAQYVRVDGLGRAVPQRRRRVFVVGYPGDWRPPAAVLFERESLSGNPPPRREAGARVTGSLGSGTQGSGWNIDPDRAGAFIPDVAHCLAAGAGGSKFGSGRDGQDDFVTHTLRADGFDASEDGTGRGTPLVPVPFNWREDDVSLKDQSPCLGQRDDVAIAFIVNAAESCATASHARRSEVARCIDSTGSFANAQGGTVVKQQMGVRRLTPRECERLQGFPDDWTLVPCRGRLMADGPRYKMIGNSMAINVMRWLGRRIEFVQSIIAT